MGPPAKASYPGPFGSKKVGVSAGMFSKLEGRAVSGGALLHARDLGGSGLVLKPRNGGEVLVLKSFSPFRTFVLSCP
jgi:hypothetical protein